MHFASRNIGWMDGWVEEDSLEDWVLSVIAQRLGLLVDVYITIVE